MIEITFTYNGEKTIIRCYLNEKMKDIYTRFANIKNKSIDSIYFIYGGEQLKEELTLDNALNEDDKKRGKMNLLVFNLNSLNTISSNNQISNTIINSKDIICPKCGENCKIKINDMKITLYECKNNHNIDYILLDEYESTQKIDLSNIFCELCITANKANTYNNEFFRCKNCNINLCPLCRSIHDKTHIIIKYEDKNYICDFHNKQFISYCKKCIKNLCYICEQNHHNHDLINYKCELPNIKEIKMKKDELRKNIDILTYNIKEMINKLNKIIENIEIFYNIFNDILLTFENNNNINYEIINNIEKISNNCIIDYLIEINNDKKIKNNLNKIIDIYNKMENKFNQMTIVYNNQKENKIKLFGNNFVFINKDNCKIVYKDKEYPLINYFNPLDINGNAFEITLKEIDNITDMSEMFYNCSNLSSLSNISNWNTSNVIDMRCMFYKCSSLSSLPDISNWDTSKVTDMSHMFGECISLSSLP